MLAGREARPHYKRFLIDLRVVPVACPACQIGLDLEVGIDREPTFPLMEQHDGERPHYHCPDCGLRVLNTKIVYPLFNNAFSLADLN